MYNRVDAAKNVYAAAMHSLNNSGHHIILNIVQNIPKMYVCCWETNVHSASNIDLKNVYVDKRGSGNQRLSCKTNWHLTWLTLLLHNCCHCELVHLSTTVSAGCRCWINTTNCPHSKMHNQQLYINQVMTIINLSITSMFSFSFGCSSLSCQHGRPN